MDLSKLSKDCLENILYNITEDLRKYNKQLADKYDSMIDDIMYDISDTDATKIVRSFKPYGEVFSMNDITEMLQRLQVSTKYCVDYYLCMNMFYNDYKLYAEAKRLDVKDFCYEMSKLFINDIDAPKHKVAKYFKSFEEN